jgi:hypothetical protein
MPGLFVSGGWLFELDFSRTDRSVSMDFYGVGWAANALVSRHENKLLGWIYLVFGRVAAGLPG